MAALDALDDWPVSTAAAAVVGPAGVLATHGDTARVFALASVTKPLVARAVQIAIEEGVVDLDTDAGPPGSTIRHLLAHTSGLAMHSDQVLAEPGTRRMYSNYGFTVLAETVQRESGIEFGRYLTEAVFEPLGMTTTRLEDGAEAAGFGATSTVADLAAFAGDLLRPSTVSTPDARRRDRRAVPRPGRCVARATASSGPTTGGWVSRSGTRNRRTGPARRIRRGPTATSGKQGGSSGQIPKRSWRWWCSRTAISATGRWTCGRRFQTRSSQICRKLHTSATRASRGTIDTQDTKTEIASMSLVGFTRSLGKTSLVEPKEQQMRASNQFADVTTGVVYVHASPAAVCPHVEWALSSTLQSKANLVWTPQPAMPGTAARGHQLGRVRSGPAPGWRTRCAHGRCCGSKSPRTPVPVVDGHRFSHTPQLGLWSGAMSANGDIMVGEMRLRRMMAQGADTLAAELDSVLGTAWDDALEAYRDGGDAGEVTWLNRGVG